MIGQESGVTNGLATVVSTSGRGLGPEEYADMVIDKIIAISPTAHPTIRQQAEAFRGQIKSILVKAFANAQRSERTTLYNMFKNQGHEDMANIIKGL